MVSFDNIADTYDTDFTYSIVGVEQRKIVREHFDKFFATNKKILEINCGTGEDALWLSQNGHELVATDVSSQMIHLAQQKNKGNSASFEQLDLKKIEQFCFANQAELVFSNFGGLNCLNNEELKSFFRTLFEKENINYLFLVIMPKNTCWDFYYRLIKFDFKTIFQRRRGFLNVNLGLKSVDTYYYNPRDIRKLNADLFRVRSVKPVGFFVPPSYMSSFFKQRPRWFNFLILMEKYVKNLSFLSRYSDHYLIVLEKP